LRLDARRRFPPVPSESNQPRVTLSSELRAWIVPGLAGTIASVDAHGQPQLVRVWAARPTTAPDEIEVYVHAGAAAGFLAGLESSARVGLNLIDVLSYRSRLFKGSGRLVQVPIDFEWLATCEAALNRVFEAVGMSPQSVERMLGYAEDRRAMLALLVRVESAFDQSPKPGAGAPL